MDERHAGRVIRCLALCALFVLASLRASAELSPVWDELPDGNQLGLRTWFNDAGWKMPAANSNPRKLSRP